MIILGLNAFHGDSSVALVRDGKLVAAAEEERFRRVKHWAGFPSESIRYCLDAAGISLSDVHHAALHQDSKANLWRKISFTLARRPDPAMVLARMQKKRKRSRIEQEFQKCFPGTSFKG